MHIFGRVVLRRSIIQDGCDIENGNSEFFWLNYEAVFKTTRQPKNVVLLRRFFLITWFNQKICELSKSRKVNYQRIKSTRCKPTIINFFACTWKDLKVTPRVRLPLENLRCNKLSRKQTVISSSSMLDSKKRLKSSRRRRRRQQKSFLRQWPNSKRLKNKRVSPRNQRRLTQRRASNSPQSHCWWARIQGRMSSCYMTIW